MKLLNRLRELRSELNIEFNIEEAKITDSQHQDLLSVESTTVDDILKINITATNLRRFYQHQD